MRTPSTTAFKRGEQTRMVRKLGRLSAADLQRVEQTFGAALGLSAPPPAST